MGIGDLARSSGDVMYRLKDLERQIQDLQTARRLESASIGTGGLRVKGGRIRIQDEQGNDTLVLSTDGLSLAGLLQVDGDIHQRVGSEFVPLAALAGGAQAATVVTEQSLSGPAGTDTGYVDLTTTGPSVTFTTHTGKWLLLMIAQVETAGDKTAGRMSYTASGAQTVAADNARSSLVNYAAPGGGVQSAVYTEVRTGTPGQITVQAKYRMIAPAATFPGSASWANRAVIVLPY